MFIFLGYLIFVLAISIHEFGHAIAMRKYGIQMKEICILGVGTKLFSFKLKKWFGDTPITIRLIPLFAFVAPTDFSYKRICVLPYLKKNHIHGAGVMMNLIMAACFLFLYMVINHLTYLNLYIILIIFLLMGLFPKWGSLLIIPFGIATLYLIYMIYFAPHATNSFNKDAGGIVVYGEVIKKEAISFQKLIELGFEINLSIALINALPFYPSDGGKILVDSIEKILNNKIPYSRIVLTSISALPFLIFVIIAVKNDLIRIFHWFF